MLTSVTWKDACAIIRLCKIEARTEVRFRRAMDAGNVRRASREARLLTIAHQRGNAIAFRNLAEFH